MRAHSSSQNFSVFLLIGFSVSLMVVSSHAVEYRKWSDATGDHTLRAKFIKLEDETVLLRKPDGKRIKIALSKLSKDDQSVVSALVKGEAEEPKAMKALPDEQERKKALYPRRLTMFWGMLSSRDQELFKILPDVPSANILMIYRTPSGDLPVQLSSEPTDVELTVGAEQYRVTIRRNPETGRVSHVAIDGIEVRRASPTHEKYLGKLRDEAKAELQKRESRRRVRKDRSKIRGRIEYSVVRDFKREVKLSARDGGGTTRLVYPFAVIIHGLSEGDQAIVFHKISAGFQILTGQLKSNHRYSLLVTNGKVENVSVGEVREVPERTTSQPVNVTGSTYVVSLP